MSFCGEPHPKRFHNEHRPERGKQWYKRLVESPMDRERKERKRRQRERARKVEGGEWQGWKVRPLGKAPGIHRRANSFVSRSKYWNKLRPTPSTSQSSFRPPPLLPDVSNPFDHHEVILLQRDRAAASGVALITCSLHCASSWLKAPPYTPFPSRALPTPYLHLPPPLVPPPPRFAVDLSPRPHDYLQPVDALANG